MQLADGDAIHIGSLLVTFHVRGLSMVDRDAGPVIASDRPARMAHRRRTRSGPYEIVGWLGSGGMGDVYRARDPRLDREVAIKVLPASFAADASRIRRFELEARAAGRLNHPNILAVLRHRGARRSAVYRLRASAGSVTRKPRRHPGSATPALTIHQAIDFARQTADGLAAAHDQGIVHRDVKPDNLFITSDGRIKILDFGIAKLTRPERRNRRPRRRQHRNGCRDGDRHGGYMSPEQVRGEAVDSRSDLFSFGAILDEMLAARPAFLKDTRAETMTAILKEEPAQPLPDGVPAALGSIVWRCLEKAKEARFQSARDLAFALESLSGEHSPARRRRCPRYRDIGVEARRSRHSR